MKDSDYLRLLCVTISFCSSPFLLQCKHVTLACGKTSQETIRLCQSWTAVSMLKVFQLLMWLKCFHSNRLNIAADKGTSVPLPLSLRPPLPHSSWRWRRQLSSASLPKFALTLGITDPYLVLRCLKRLNTAHRVPDTFLPPCVHTHKRSQGLYLSRHWCLNLPPPPPHHKEKHCRSFWMSAGQGLPHICKMPRHFGRLAPTGGAEEPWWGGAQVLGALLCTLTFGRRLVWVSRSWAELWLEVLG